MKEKITLQKEMETLLIPLYGRASMTSLGVCHDPYAQETIKKIEYPFAKLKVAKKLQVMMAIRCAILDDFVHAFLEENPGATVISLGSGLDARFARIKGYGRWYDLDFPQVVQLRDALLPKMPNQYTIASSVTQWDWMDKIDRDESKVLIIAEGLLMYLTPENVTHLFSLLCSKYQDAVFVFDAYSCATVKRIGLHPSLKKTEASIHWGIDDPKELPRAVSGLLYDSTRYLTEEHYLMPLGFFYRRFFWLAGKFAAAKEAHRIFIMKTK